MSDDQVGPTDDPAFDESDFDDPAFDDLRALLAEARVVDPVPADVAARLEDTLSSLQAERRRPHDDPVAAVVPLRRRLAPVLVAAAAAVVVVVGGVGITQTLRDDSGQAASSADKAASADAGAGSSESLAGPVPELTTARFAQEVAGLDVSGLAGPDYPTAAAGDSIGRSPAPTDSKTPLGALVPQTPTCAGPGLAGTRTTTVLLDGRPAALVMHPVRAGEQRVDAWSCDGSKRLASTTVRR